MDEVFVVLLHSLCVCFVQEAKSQAREHRLEEKRRAREAAEAVECTFRPKLYPANASVWSRRVGREEGNEESEQASTSLGHEGEDAFRSNVEYDLPREEDGWDDDGIDGM